MSDVNESRVSADMLLMQCCTELRCGKHASAGITLQQLIPVFIERIPALSAQEQPLFQESLVAALAAQERGDWIALADELEYGIKDRIL